MEAPAQKDKVGPASPVSSPRVPVDSPTPGEFEERRNWTPPEPPRHYAVWFDIPVRDIDRALRFYSAILGVRLKKEQAGPGAAIALLPYHEGFVCGSLVQNMDARPSESGPLIYLNAQGRLDEALSVVERHGGKVLVSRHSIEPFGSRAIVLDCEGNRIALHSK
jgi:predicted enzyme related to lactoylglutathione lyase